VIEVTDMTHLKDRMVQLVAQNAAARVAALAGELVHAASEEKEAIRAGLDFERWLAETCEQCLDRPQVLK
jgi:hypothetical protein